MRSTARAAAAPVRDGLRAVGTFLVMLNQGDLIVSGGSATLYWKIPMTYLVPFLVSSWGALSNARR